jgi:hypothetical protein
MLPGASPARELMAFPNRPAYVLGIAKPLSSPLFEEL